MAPDQIWIADMRPVHNYYQPLPSDGLRQRLEKAVIELAGENGSRAIGITAANLPTGNRRISLRSEVVY